MRIQITDNLIAGRGEAAEAAAEAIRERGGEVRTAGTRALRLLTDGRGVCGAAVWDADAGDFAVFASRKVLLADPDADLLFSDRCGIAAAYCAGASMSDLERAAVDADGDARTLGGLITDADGRTDVPGLWAAGAPAAMMPRTGAEAAARGRRCGLCMAGTDRPADPDSAEKEAAELLVTGGADIAGALAHMEEELDRAAPAPWDLRALQTVCEAQHHLNELPPAGPADTLRRLLLENRLIAVRLHLACCLERRHAAEGFPSRLPGDGGYRVRTAMRDGMFYIGKEETGASRR